jgi:phage head maturation protease
MSQDDPDKKIADIPMKRAQTKFPSEITAKQFVEAKRNSRNLESQGDYNEVISPSAFDKFETDYVPLTMYVNGERRVIGQAKVNGRFVQGYIAETSNVDLKDLVKKNELNGVSFGFHINSSKGDYRDLMDIPEN